MYLFLCLFYWPWLKCLWNTYWLLIPLPIPHQREPNINSIGLVSDTENTHGKEDTDRLYWCTQERSEMHISGIIRRVCHSFCTAGLHSPQWGKAKLLSQGPATPIAPAHNSPVSCNTSKSLMSVPPYTGTNSSPGRTESLYLEFYALFQNNNNNLKTGCSRKNVY